MLTRCCQVMFYIIKVSIKSNKSIKGGSFMKNRNCPHSIKEKNDYGKQ